MKIGYVLKQFPKLSETFVLNEILELERQGADVTIFALDSGRDPRIHPGLAQLRAPIHFVGTGSSSQFAAELLNSRTVLEQGGERLRSAIWDVLSFPESRPLPLIRAALDLVCQAPQGLDRLHAHFAGPAAQVARIASAGLGIPFGFTCHAKDIYHDSVAPEALRSLHDSADLVVTVCEANRQYLEDRVLSGPSERLQVLYNGVDLNVFSNGARRPAARPSVLAVGRLVAKKGFADLIDAISILESRGLQVECEIAGDGILRGALEAQIGRLGLESTVRLLGAVDQHTVRDRLQEAWVVALPCVVAEDGNRDALPTVLLEALASGTPVVSTPVTGVAEIIQSGEEGFLVPEHDPRALAAALEAILTRASLRDRLGLRCRATAEAKFDLRKNVAGLLDLFRSSESTSPSAVVAGAPAAPLAGVGS